MVSTQRPAATLDDWEGPLYPSPVKQLATVLRRWRTDMTGNQWLGCACRDLGGYVLRFRIATQDGYKWWWFLQFELGGASRNHYLLQPVFFRVCYSGCYSAEPSALENYALGFGDGTLQHAPVSRLGRHVAGFSAMFEGRSSDGYEWRMLNFAARDPVTS